MKPLFIHLTLAAASLMSLAACGQRSSPLPPSSSTSPQSGVTVTPPTTFGSSSPTAPAMPTLGPSSGTDSARPFSSPYPSSDNSLASTPEARRREDELKSRSPPPAMGLQR